MKKAFETIVQFVTEKWLVLFLVLTIIAVLMFVLVAISCIRTIRDSTTIPNLKAQAENDYYIASRYEFGRKEEDDERSESSNEFTDLFG